MKAYLLPWSPQLLSILRIVTGFLFVEHGNRPLHKFIYGLVGAALDILLNQLCKLGPKANFHVDILSYALKGLLKDRALPHAPTK